MKFYRILERVESKLDTLLTQQALILSLILKNQNIMAIAQAQLDTDLQTLVTGIQKLGTDLATAYAALTAKINAGEDFTNEDTTVNNLISQISDFDATAVTNSN